MALSIAICVRCDGCIAYHVPDALKAGVTQDEILETIGVAVMRDGGPATIYACDSAVMSHAARLVRVAKHLLPTRCVVALVCPLT